ncbi:MAG: hypothetical protein KGL39_39660 [Patescibacteria group bacterium]|nr:hypothetical protein [Patescibacteria group bacterium]
MNLLIIDGSNVVMRCAFGGEVAPEPAVRTATNMVERAARELRATHLILALDCPGVPNWRRQLFPDYKAHRTVDTYPWIDAAAKEWSRRDWFIEAIDGYEADDLIATLALRAKPRARVTVLSGDTDVLPLVEDNIAIVKPVNGGRFEPVTYRGVCERYGVRAPGRLVDLKALTGETGDNVPGVDGIGPVRAQKLLGIYECLEGVIDAGVRNACKFSVRVAAAADIARLSYRLVSLVRNAPIEPIAPAHCIFAGGAA